MINGKVKEGDIIVEVETKKTYSVAPQVWPGRTVMEYRTKSDAEWASVGFEYREAYVMSGTKWSYAARPGMNNLVWNSRPTNWETGDTGFKFTWDRSATPDAFGNYAWTHKVGAPDVFLGRVLWSALLPTDNPTAGKYYGGNWVLEKTVTAMPGNFDYVPQGALRLKLLATKTRDFVGGVGGDILIAQSDVINGADWRNAGTPFHPGVRTDTWELKPVAAFPATYTHLRVVIEYDAAWAASNRTIYLPKNFFPDLFYHPHQLDFVRPFNIPRDITIWEDNFDMQEWVKSSTGTISYDWENRRINNTTTGGIQAAINGIPDESHIKTDGAKLSFGTDYTGSFTASITGNTTWTKTYPAGSQGWKTETIPASAFTNGNCVVKFTSNNVYGVQLYGNIGHDDTDGFYYFKYAQYQDSAASINIDRVDTEVSTCSVAFRTREDYDVDDTFGVGKRVRIRLNSDLGYETTYNGVNVLPKSTLFTGEITRRGAKYPKKTSKSRPEVTFFATNSHNKLLKEQEFVLSNLEDYRLMLPYSGIATVTNRGVTTPEYINPNQSWEGIDDYSGLWSLYSAEADIPILDALMITRNSQFGYCWFDRFNRYHLKNTMPVEVLTFSDDPGVWDLSYSDLDLSYSTSDVINWIALEQMSNSITLDDKGFFQNDTYIEKTIIANEASVAKYGKAEVKFQSLRLQSWIDGVDPYIRLKSEVLDKYSTPKVMASTLKFPVKSMDDAGVITQLEMYQLIRVVFKDKLDEQYRVTSISHKIVPGETWIVDVGFGFNTDSPPYDASYGSTM